MFRMHDGRLDSQHSTGFVVKLDGISIGAVFDPHAFGALFAVTNYLTGESLINLAGVQGNVSPEKPEHVRRGE
jgi:hypothetical protein